MGERKEEDLYRNFSRKDLQGLCKKYGLPANKSNSEMATSLILYLEMKNLSSRAIWKGTRRDHFASGTAELQAGVRMTSTDDQRKDCGRMASHSGSGENQHHNHRDVQHNDLQNGKGSATSDKASEDAGILTQLHRGSNSGACLQENTFSSVVSSPVVAPSPTFTFDVCCEDGIQLYVDLDSSPADWIESLKAGVHICHDVHKPMSQSFHQDIGLLCCSKQKCDSVIMDPSKETNNVHVEVGSKETDNVRVEVGSDSTPVLADIQAQTDELDRREGSLSSPGLKSLCNAVHSLENSKDHQSILSSSLESGTEGKLPESSVREETLAADSDVNAAIQKSAAQAKTCSNFTGSSVPSDPKCSGMPAHQNASAGDVIYKNPSLQRTYGLLDAVLKCSESSTTVCRETQASTCAALSQDFEYSPSGVRRCVDLAKQLKNNELVQFELVKSVQTPMRHELQTEPVQAVDQSKPVSCSPVLNSVSLNLAENSSKVDGQYGIASFFRKSDRQIREAQTHSAGNHSKGIFFSCNHRYEPQDTINLTNGIETETAGFLRTHEAGRGIDELKKKDAAVHPCCNDESLDLVSKKNGFDCRISCKSKELKEDSCTSPSTANATDPRTDNSGNGREVSEFLNSENQIEKPCKGHADSESNGKLKRKRHFNHMEGRSKFVNTEAKILRSSKQFVGDVHSKRRRSSRLFSK